METRQITRDTYLPVDTRSPLSHSLSLSLSNQSKYRVSQLAGWQARRKRDEERKNSFGNYCNSRYAFHGINDIANYALNIASDFCENTVHAAINQTPSMPFANWWCCVKLLCNHFEIISRLLQVSTVKIRNFLIHNFFFFLSSNIEISCLKSSSSNYNIFNDYRFY